MTEAPELHSETESVEYPATRARHLETSPWYSNPTLLIAPVLVLLLLGVAGLIYALVQSGQRTDAAIAEAAETYSAAVTDYDSAWGKFDVAHEKLQEDKRVAIAASESAEAVIPAYVADALTAAAKFSYQDYPELTIEKGTSEKEIADQTATVQQETAAVKKVTAQLNDATKRFADSTAAAAENSTAQNEPTAQLTAQSAAATAALTKFGALADAGLIAELNDLIAQANSAVANGAATAEVEKLSSAITDRLEPLAASATAKLPQLLGDFCPEPIYNFGGGGCVGIEQSQHVEFVAAGQEPLRTQHSFDFEAGCAVGQQGSSKLFYICPAGTQIPGSMSFSHPAQSTPQNFAPLTEYSTNPDNSRVRIVFLANNLGDSHFAAQNANVLLYRVTQ